MRYSQEEISTSGRSSYSFVSGFAVVWMSGGRMRSVGAAGAALLRASLMRERMSMAHTTTRTVSATDSQRRLFFIQIPPGRKNEKQLT